jgi:hypothetical protein
MPDQDIEKAMIKAGLSLDLFGHSRAVVRCGRFELLRPLGRGSMGLVYEGLDTERGHRVAVKVLTRLDANAIFRLKREFRSLSETVHPNLVALDELFHEHGQWFFSMELVDGEPFARWVRADVEDAGARLERALRQLVTAVHAVHGAGQLHRDLKPSNVLVTKEGRVVVLDFGLVLEQARPNGSRITHSEILGTPAYMAPELGAGQEASQASDWYAVGVMLFEALTGRLPFEGNPLQILSEKQHREAPDPRGLVASLPAALSDVCMSLLTRSPCDRADGKQLLAVLGGSASSVASVPLQRLSASGSTALLGRARELALLEAGLDKVRQGSAASILVHSVSGGGKSALLEHFAARCERTGSQTTVVLRGRCHPQESVPYKVFDSVVDALCRLLCNLPDRDLRGLLPRHLSALLQLFPVLSRVPGMGEAASLGSRLHQARDLRVLAFAALKELLLRLTDRMTVVIAVDDLQWGDIDSAHMLAHVLNSPEAPPLLFVGAYRSDEADSSEFLQALLCERGGDRSGQPQCLELGPLDAAAAGELARCLLVPQMHGRQLISQTIAVESQGVPFFVSELAQRYNASCDRGQTPQGMPPISLEQLILERVAARSPEAQRLLRTLSVAAGPLERSVAFEAAGLAAGERVLRELRGGRQIRRRGAAPDDWTEIYHDRLRETIVRSMPADALAETHRRLALALERSDFATPERLVLHYSGAGDRVRAGATAAKAAAAAANKLAFDRAAGLYRMAIDLLPIAGHTKHDLFRGLADALANAGRGAQAGDAYLEAFATAPPEQALLMRRLAAEQYLGSPRGPEKGLMLARATLARIGVELPQHEAALLQAYLWQRMLLRRKPLRVPLAPTTVRDPAQLERLETLSHLFPPMLWMDTLAGGLVHARYWNEARSAGDIVHMLRAYTTEVLNLALLGGPRNEQRAAHLLAVAGELAERIDSPYARALVHGADANRLAWNSRQFEDARRAADLAADVFENVGHGTYFWERAGFGLVRFVTIINAGKLTDLASLSAESERDAYERSDHLSAGMMLTSRPYFDLVKDDPESALGMIERMRPWMRLSTNLRAMWWLRASEALIYLGRCRESVELVEAEWPTFRNSFLYRCEPFRNNGRYYRARAALAGFLETRDPALRTLAWRATRELADRDSVHGALRSMLLGTLHQLDGDAQAASGYLRQGRARAHLSQAGLCALYAERALCLLNGDSAGVDRSDAAMRAQGVANPQRWSWLCAPTAS